MDNIGSEIDGSGSAQSLSYESSDPDFSSPVMEEVNAEEDTRNGFEFFAKPPPRSVRRSMSYQDQCNSAELHQQRVAAAASSFGIPTSLAHALIGCRPQDEYLDDNNAIRRTITKNMSAPQAESDLEAKISELESTVAEIQSQLFNAGGDAMQAKLNIKDMATQMDLFEKIQSQHGEKDKLTSMIMKQLRAINTNLTNQVSVLEIELAGANSKIDNLMARLECLEDRALV